MKLCDIFEKFEKDPTPLEPGEQRAYADTTIRNINLINDKIRELEDLLHKSRSIKDAYMKDADLQRTMSNLITRLNRKQDYMIRLKQRPTTDQQNIINELKQECGDFIEIAKKANAFLYRGLRSYTSAFEGRSRTERKSLHSKSEISDYFDDAMQAHGVKALRKASIFTTTDKKFAGTFGYTVYLIFPKNGFSFLSTNQRDLILDDWIKIADRDKISEFFKELAAWMEANIAEYTSHNLWISLQYNYLDSRFYNLQQNFADENPLKLPEQFNKTMKDFVSYESVIQRMEPNTTDLVRPMESEVEILVNGEYWAVRADQWETLLRRVFFDDSSD
jgi:hypothetical protein